MKTHVFYHQFRDGSWGVVRRFVGPDNRWQNKLVMAPSNYAFDSDEFVKWAHYTVRVTAPHTGKAYFELPLPH